jgi:hypothetical protein
MKGKQDVLDDQTQRYSFWDHGVSPSHYLQVLDTSLA